MTNKIPVLDNTGKALLLEKEFQEIIKNHKMEKYCEDLISEYGDRRFRLTNAVLTFYINQKLNLMLLQENLKQQGFNNAYKERFSGLIYKFKSEKSKEKFTFLIFNTGAVVLVGLKTILKENIKDYQEYLLRFFKLANLEVVVEKYKISNLVFAFELPEKEINFYKILQKAHLKHRSEYSREIFPAFFFKPWPELKIISLLYSSGKSILTGFTGDLQNKIEESFEIVLKELNSCEAFPEKLSEKYKPYKKKSADLKI